MVRTHIAATESYRTNVFVIQAPLVIHTQFVVHKNVTPARIQNAVSEPNVIKWADALIVSVQSALLEIHLLDAEI